MQLPCGRSASSKQPAWYRDNPWLAVHELAPTSGGERKLRVRSRNVRARRLHQDDLKQRQQRRLTVVGTPRRIASIVDPLYSQSFSFWRCLCTTSCLIMQWFSQLCVHQAVSKDTKQRMR